LIGKRKVGPGPCWRGLQLSDRKRGEGGPSAYRSPPARWVGARRRPICKAGVRPRPPRSSRGLGAGARFAGRRRRWRPGPGKSRAVSSPRNRSYGGPTTVRTTATRAAEPGRPPHADSTAPGAPSSAGNRCGWPRGGCSSQPRGRPWRRIDGHDEPQYAGPGVPLDAIMDMGCFLPIRLLCPIQDEVCSLPEFTFNNLRTS